MSQESPVIDLSVERAHRIILQEMQVFRAEVYARLHDIRREVRAVDEKAGNNSATLKRIEASQKLAGKLLWAVVAAIGASVGTTLWPQLAQVLGG